MDKARIEKADSGRKPKIPNVDIRNSRRMKRTPGSPMGWLDSELGELDCRASGSRILEAAAELINTGKWARMRCGDKGIQIQGAMCNSNNRAVASAGTHPDRGLGRRQGTMAGHTRNRGCGRTGRGRSIDA